MPAIASAAAGGVRCSLNDMLTWMRMWLDPELKPPGQDRAWLSRAQHEALWTAHTPMPMSEQQKRWNNGNFSAYGYGWRLSDVDGVLRVAHTGTLGGMYSALNLLPDKRSGFVFMINGEGSRARAVLNAALVKQFTAPGRAPPAAWYIEELKAEDQASASAHRPAHMRLPMRQLASPSSLAPWLGRYRDPWFGEISICERDRHVRFDSVKSPLMTGDVMRVGERLLVDWDETASTTNRGSLSRPESRDPDARQGRSRRRLQLGLRGSGLHARRRLQSVAQGGPDERRRRHRCRSTG